MSKKLIIAVVSVALLALSLPNAFAAINETKKKEIEDTYKQIFELRKQVILKYVEAGELTKEEGDTAIKGLGKALQNAEERGFRFNESGYGTGCGIGNSGPQGNSSMMGSYGYDMMGAYGYDMMGYSGQL